MGLKGKVTMITILKKLRAVVFGTIALFLYLFGYRHAKENAENQQTKGVLNAVKIAKKARDSLSDSERINRLHNKYKR